MIIGFLAILFFVLGKKYELWVIFINERIDYGNIDKDRKRSNKDILF